jgi:acetyl-CoA C-acetyltransferase
MTMGNRCAVIGVGQTHYTTKRRDVSIAGLVREAALRALQDAGLTFKDIDAVVIGKAPDLFEGVMMPEAYLADALGAAGKPMMRVHTAGSVGGSTALVGASLIQGGVHERVLVVAFEKQSESNATWALSTTCRSARRWWWARAATSRRTSASTCAGPAPPATSAPWWRSRTG